MLALLFSRTGVALAGVVAALGLLTASHWYAYSAGKQSVRIEQLKADVTAYQEREGIDHEVDAADRFAICVELGGLQSDCEQLRRVEEASEGE